MGARPQGGTLTLASLPSPPPPLCHLPAAFLSPPMAIMGWALSLALPSCHLLLPPHLQLGAGRRGLEPLELAEVDLVSFHLFFCQQREAG